MHATGNFRVHQPGPGQYYTYIHLLFSVVFHSIFQLFFRHRWLAEFAR